MVLKSVYRLLIEIESSDKMVKKTSWSKNCFYLVGSVGKRLHGGMESEQWKGSLAIRIKLPFGYKYSRCDGIVS